MEEAAYEEAAVSRPPSESLAASKARDRSMQHLTRQCESCMPKRLSLGLWDVRQALVNDSSAGIDRPMVDKRRRT